MPRITRSAHATWEGSVARGAGTLTAASSGAFVALPVTLASRIAEPEGKTSPEELLAAAHAGCFITSLGSELARAGVPPSSMTVACTITMDEIEGQGHHIVGSDVAATVRAEGLDEETLAGALTDADEGCPFSAMLKRSGATVTVSATREEG